MSKGAFILLLFICFTKVSIAQKLLSDKEQDALMPVYELKYKLDKYNFLLEDTSIISTHAAYILTAYGIKYKGRFKELSKPNQFVFIRFFVDGKVFVSFPYLSYPSIEEINDLTYGRFGKYIIKNQKIVVEIYDGVKNLVFLFYEPNKEQTGIIHYGSSRILNPLFNNPLNKDVSEFYKKEYTKLYNWPQ